MLEPMRELTTTEYVEMRYRIPIDRLTEIQKVMASYGAEESKEDCESVPWKEVYPDFNPSIALRGARKRENLTQQALAQIVGVNQTHISEMENRKRPIGREMAKRLAAVLNVDYRIFL
jgi:DNA-binding XRE family transcriptional regulator